MGGSGAGRGRGRGEGGGLRAMLLLRVVHFARAAARVALDGAALLLLLWLRCVTAWPIPTIAKTAITARQLHQAKKGTRSVVGYRFPVPTC